MGVWIGTAALLAAMGACSGGEPFDPMGLWVGTAEHEGSTGGFALRLQNRRGDSVDVAVSMLPLEAYDIPVGTGLLVGDTLRLGGWTGVFDPDERTLRGSVPGALLPAYDAPFVLRPAERFPEPMPEPAAPTVEPLWSFETDGPVWAGVAVADGRVFVATDSGAVHALSEADGSELWSARVGGAVRATPTVVEDQVYLHSDDGRITRLSAGTGRVSGTLRVGGAAERLPPSEPGSRYDSYASSVLVVDGLAIVGTYDGAVVAVDMASGEVRWRHEVSSSVLGTPTTDGERVFYGTFDGEVGAVALSDGTPVWETATSGAVVSSPTLAGDLLVVGNRTYDLSGLRAADGTVSWTHYVWFSWVESTATVADGVAYVGTSDARLLNALDAATGAPRWSYRTAGSTWATPAVGAGAVYVGTVGVSDYFVDHQARFHAVDAETGAPLWRFLMPRPEGAAAWGFASSPAVGERGVYVGTIDGRVLAFPASAR